MAWSLFKREAEKFGTQLQKVLESPSTFQKRISSAIDLFYRFFDEDPMTFSFILLTEHGFPQNWKISPDVNPYSLVLNFLKKGKKAGVFHFDDSRLATAMVLGLVLEPALQCATQNLKGPMLRRAPYVYEGCMKVLESK